jgi:Mechanosensitive ion channel
VTIRRPHHYFRYVDLLHVLTSLIGRILSCPACSVPGAEAPTNVPLSNSWLVEDITLTTSTLRYAATNEVATINNSSVANSRIVNCARSPKAQVTINVKLLLDASQRQLEELRGKIELYLEDSRVWVGLILYRAEDINNEIGYVVMTYRAQHIKCWQELAAILAHKGEWQRFANKTANNMGILFDIPPIQMMPMGVSSRNSKLSQNRRKMADLIRGVSENGEQGNTRVTDDEIFGVVSQYSSPLPPQLDSTTLDPATLEAFGIGPD